VHLKGILSLCGAIVAAIALTAASGATTAKTHKIVRLDVSSKASIVHYLRSIHVNPKGVVIQRGVRNYAGPRCPGKNWSCTSTTHPVVQVAAHGGKNTFRCSSARCAVVQVATAPSKPTTGNDASCVKTTGLGANCTISQSSSGSTPNKARVWEDAGKLTGLNQTALYTASITQNATGSGANLACVHQSINIDGSTGKNNTTSAIVALEAHQSIGITQDSMSGGNTVEDASTPVSGVPGCVALPTLPCSADLSPATLDPCGLSQTQILSSIAMSKGSIIQNENKTDSGPNMTLDIKQNQSDGFKGFASGLNKAYFTQINTLTALATTPVAPTQWQSSPNGGILAKVKEDSSDPSTAIARQKETQCEDAQPSATVGQCASPGGEGNPYLSPLSQTQYGPIRKDLGDSSLTGDPGDSFTVNQRSQQDNDTKSGQTNVLSGGFHTDGNGTVTQDTNVDGSPSTTTSSGQDVNTTTTCSGSSCTSTGTTPTFTESGHQLAAQNVDLKEFGYGGMRNDGTGSISVSGITGTVERAVLYWNGPTDSSNPAVNASVNFAGQPVIGTNTGIASDNCWGYTNSQSYRADVTNIVNGDGSYSLGNFVKPNVSDPNGYDANINGVALYVFYSDGDSSNDRNAVVWSGNDSNVVFGSEPAGWDETLTSVSYPGGSASLDFVVSDGQTADDPQLLVNGQELAPVGPIFSGSTGGGSFNSNGSLWDVKSFDISSLLTQATTSVHVTTGTEPSGTEDCISAVAIAVNTPVSAPVIVGPAAIAPHQPVASGPQATSTPTAGVPRAGVLLAGSR
jgi:hypothetical protein